MTIAEAADRVRSLPFLIDNAIRTRLVMAGAAAREYAVDLFMLPEAPLTQPPVPGRVTKRSGRLAGSVRVVPPIVTGSIEDGAVYTVGLEAGGNTIRYAAIQELGGTVNVPEMRPVQARALAWQGPAGPVFAMRTRAHTVTLPERPYMGPGLQQAADGLPEQVDADIAALRARVFGSD